MSVSQLCEMFELENKRVHCIVNKMIINRQLAGSWDQPTDSIFLHKIEPTYLQMLALDFAGKTASFVDGNERMFEGRNGNYRYDDRREWNGNRGGRGDWG